MVRSHISVSQGFAGAGCQIVSENERLPDPLFDRQPVGPFPHRRIPQAHAVVLRAAGAGGVFLQPAQAGDGLAGVENF